MTAVAVAAERRWEAYAAGTRGEHFRWWCSEHAVQSIGQFAGRPLDLEPWQFELMLEAMAVDDAGDPYWQIVVLVVPRKNGKTTLLAARALYELVEEDDQPEVLLAASSDRQAGRLFDGVEAFTRRAPALDAGLVHRAYVGELARADGGGKILRMSSEAGALHGYNPSLVVPDELHTWLTARLRRAWAALTTAGGARRRTQVFGITTAGEAVHRKTSILGVLIDQNERDGEVEKPHAALTISRNHEARVLVYNYSAPTRDPEDLDAIRLANPASWITTEYLARKAADPSLTSAEFLQLHGCVWSSGKDAFVPVERWEQLADADEARARLASGSRIALGMDGSRTYDTSVVAVASMGDDGRVAVGARVFSARRDAPAHVYHEGGKIRMADVEDHVASLFASHDVSDAAYDPRYLVRSAELLEERLGVDRIAPVEPQSRLMRDAIATFYSLVTDGRIVHDGDPVVAAHVAAAVASQDDRGWVVRKRVQSQPIDALIAIVLAAWRATLDEGSAPAVVDLWGSW